jgi:hypothetical protein
MEKDRPFAPFKMNTKYRNKAKSRKVFRAGSIKEEICRYFLASVVKV